MSPYTIGWAIMVIVSVALAAIVLIKLDRWTRCRWFLAVGIVVTCITPYRFDGEHFAPSLAVAVFRSIFEADADPTGAWTITIMAWGAALLGILGVAGVRRLRGR